MTLAERFAERMGGDGQQLLGSELERRRAGTVSLPLRLWIALREQSEKTGVPVSRLVVRALEASGTDGWKGFEELMVHMRATAESDGQRTRYVFRDGSAIVAAGGAWDVEGDKPFSWRGAEE